MRPGTKLKLQQGAAAMPPRINAGGDWPNHVGLLSISHRAPRWRGTEAPDSLEWLGLHESVLVSPLPAQPPCRWRFAARARHFGTVNGFLGVFPSLWSGAFIETVPLFRIFSLSTAWASSGARLRRSRFARCSRRQKAFTAARMGTRDAYTYFLLFQRTGLERMFVALIGKEGVL